MFALSGRLSVDVGNVVEFTRINFDGWAFDGLLPIFADFSLNFRR